VKRAFETTKAIFHEAMEDAITGEAAKAAYYFFLSFFPAILALFAFTGLLGGDATFEWIMGHLRRALPGESANLLGDTVQEITGDSRPGLLSFGIVATLWSASNVFAILTEGLNRMYDIEEGRPWWKRRLLAIAAMTAALVLLTVSVVSLLAGPAIVATLGMEGIWLYLRWPIAFVLLVALLWLVYYLLPARDQGGAARPVAVGAVTGALLWVGVTAGFRVYVANFGNYNEAYGFIGAVIVLLLWLYLTALAILFGGEVAATLEQRSDPEKWQQERVNGDVDPARAKAVAGTKTSTSTAGGGA
jgi:membrane protein